MIVTLPITIILEGLAVIGYCRWRRRPFQSILLTSVPVNILTQSLLWMVLNISFRDYWMTLLIAEFLIWIVESLMLYAVPANQLALKSAIFLSLKMNLMSFALGLFLPI